MDHKRIEKALESISGSANILWFLLLIIWITMVCQGCQAYKFKDSTYLNDQLVNRREIVVYVVGSEAMREGMSFKIENFFTAEIESSRITPEKWAEIVRESAPFISFMRALLLGGI